MRKLDLSWNGFGTDGAKAIGEALKANSSLEELDVSWVWLWFACDEKIDCVVVFKITCTLHVFTSIFPVYYGDVQKFLSGNKPYKPNAYRNNRINTEGAVLLAKGLVANDMLKNLKVRLWNPNMETLSNYVTIYT